MLLQKIRSTLSDSHEAKIYHVKNKYFTGYRIDYALLISWLITCIDWLDTKGKLLQITNNS